MSDVAIRVENLSKLYRIGAQQRHDTLRDTIADFRLKMTDSRRRRRNLPSSILDLPSETDFWALKEVSFEVKRGEVVGIIGRNGAGKSTLLKILSRITEPTEGRAEIHGRVGSLLEVGTGFHPELTGRENIYLNGAILGMRRTEIAAKFDEIVAFSEIEKFLDTPVKRYSSGMYVRLAFAVAAHLEPEILLVDEVLAVGDATFQKKCLGKMGDVAQEGRTILFVSHNMSAIQRLCARSFLLEAGQIAAWGNTPEIVNRYVATDAYTATPRKWNDVSHMNRRGSGEAKFKAVSFSGSDRNLGYQPYTDGSLEMQLRITSDTSRSVGSIAVTIYDQYATKLVNADTLALGRPITLTSGENHFLIRIRQLHLNQGIYVLGLWMADPAGGVLDYIESVLGFQVLTPEQEGLGVRPSSDGVVSCDFSLSTAAAPAEASSGWSQS